MAKAKRVLAFVMAMVMTVTMVSFPTFAEDPIVDATITGGVCDLGNDLAATFDGSVSTIVTIDNDGNWRDPAQTRTYTYTLDKAYDLSEVQVVWATAWNGNEANKEAAPTDYTIQTTTDGTTWVDAKVVTGCTDTAFGSTYEEVANRLSYVDALDTNNTGVKGVRIKAKGFPSGYAAIAEVYFRGAVTSVPGAGDPVPTPIDAVTAVGDTSYSTYTGELAVDNDPDTFWVASGYNTGNGTLTVELDKVYTLSNMTITWRCTTAGGVIWNSGNTNRSASYDVYVSTTDTAEASFTLVGNYQFADTNVDNLTFDPNVEAKYVKIVNKSCPHRVAIAEVDFTAMVVPSGEPEPGPGASTPAKIESITVDSKRNSGNDDYNTGDTTKMFDGDTTTAWFRGWPKAKYTNLTVNLKNLSDLTEIKIDWTTENSEGINWDNGAERPHAYTVSVSGTTDGDDFVEVGKITANTKTGVDTFTVDAKAVKRILIAVGADRSGSISIDEIIVTGTEVASADYTIKYVDTEGNPLADDSVQQGGVGSTVSVPALAITGYKPDAETKDVTVLEDGSAVVTFTYTKQDDWNYTVKYQDEQGNPVAEDTTGSVSYPYTIEKIDPVEVEGYFLPDSKENVTLTVNCEIITFTYELLPPGRPYTVKYVDEAGNPVKDDAQLTAEYPFTTIVTPALIDGYYAKATVQESVEIQEGDVITFTYVTKESITDPDVDKTFATATATGFSKPAQAIDGITATGNGAHGGWNAQNGKVEIELEGRYNLSYIYLYMGGTGNWGWTAPNDVTISVAGDDKVYTVVAKDMDLWARLRDGQVGGKYTTSASSFMGNIQNASYVTLELALDTTETRYVKIEYGECTAEPHLTEVSFKGERVFKDKVDFTVHYVDENGDDLAPVEERSGDNGDTVKAFAKTVEDDEKFLLYELKSDATQTLVLDKNGENKIVFEYETRPVYNYTVTYEDASGNELAPAAEFESLYPYEEVLTAVPVDGYFTPDAKAVTIADGDSFTFTYKTMATDTDMTVLPNDVSGPIWNDEFPPLNTIDGNKDTLWFAPGYGNGLEKAPTNLTYHFAAPINLSEVSITWGCLANGNADWSYDGACAASSFEIQVSSTDNGDDFVTIYTRDAFIGRVTETISDLGNYNAKRVRISITSFKERASIREITFKGYASGNFVSEVPAESQLYWDQTTAVKVPISIVTEKGADGSFHDPINDIAVNDLVGGVVSGIELVSSEEKADSKTWNFVIVIAPTGDVSGEIDVSSDVVTYVHQTVFPFTRTASADLFSDEAVTGENVVYVDMSTVGEKTIGSENYSTWLATIDVQYPFDGSDYEGYTDFVVEMVEVTHDGHLFDVADEKGYELTVDRFVREGDTYYANIPYKTKSSNGYDGVDRLRVKLVLYGINSKGNKVKVDTRTVLSNLVYLNAPAGKIDILKAKDHITIWDMLPDIADQLGYMYMPEFSDLDWELYEKLYEERNGKTKADETKNDATVVGSPAYLKALCEYVAENKVVGKQQSTLVINLGSKTAPDGTTRNKALSHQLSIKYGWNYLKDIRPDSITFIGNSLNKKFSTLNGILEAPEATVEGYRLTIYKEDYNRLNQTGSSLVMQGNGVGWTTSATAAHAYNSIRRSLGNNNIVPIVFALDWWSDVPFAAAEISVDLPRDWVENHGNGDLAVYRLGSYDAKKDNDITMTKVTDGVKYVVSYKPDAQDGEDKFRRSLSYKVTGKNNLWSNYAIVSETEVKSSMPDYVDDLYKDNVATGGAWN